MVQRQGRLEDPGGAGSALEMTDVRLDRAERHRVDRQAEPAEDRLEALDLGEVAHLGRRAVPLEQGHRGRREAGACPGALDRQALADRVGRRDSLAATVGGSADAAQHGVDPVAGAFGVGEPFEQEDRRALAHHEAVGAVGVRTGAGGGERADLAELDERRRAHVGVDPAGEHGVVVALLETLDGGADRRHRRRAGRVTDVVGTLEVEQVGDPARDDVGELAGHAVLGDVGEAIGDAGAELALDRLAHLGRQAAQAGRAGELPGVFGEEQPAGGDVVAVATHGVAEHHGGAVGVERTVRVAVVDERLARGGDRPLLGAVHLVGDARRDRQLPGDRIPGPVAHPTADLGVGLVGRLGIGIEVGRGLPTLGGRLADRVAAAPQVLPEGGHVGRIRQDRAQADDRDRCVLGLGHGSLHSAAETVAARGVRALSRRLPPARCGHRAGRPRHSCRRSGLPGRRESP